MIDTFFSRPFRGNLSKALVLLLALVWGIPFFSCNQDPIFYEISFEVKPLEPRIEGTPTTLVQCKDSFYVGSRFSETLYEYSDARWKTLPEQPGGPIIDIAATDDPGTLYALTGNPGTLTLRKKDMVTDSTWETIRNHADYPVLQSLYADATLLFLGAQKKIGDNTYAILYYDSENNTLQIVKEGTKLLTGAAFLGSTHYLATSGDGIIKVTDPASPDDAPADTAPNNIIGLVRVNSRIVAVSSDGYMLYSDSGAFTPVSTGYHFTGALALWKKDEVQLLLLGIHGTGSSTTHGYREILLQNGELDLGTMGLRTPGNEDPSSVSNRDIYNSTLGKHPVISMIQAPDTTLFAATAKNGVWSYRQRDGEWQWNAEE
ncbi:MAG: hypothetical protein LBT14_03500 [Treponema sp.]|nr:hypothetical protein [Treponema sp.]